MKKRQRTDLSHPTPAQKKERLREYGSRAYYKKHRKVRLEKARIYQQEYRLRNKEKVRQSRASYNRKTYASTNAAGLKARQDTAATRAFTASELLHESNPRRLLEKMTLILHGERGMTGV